MTDDDYLAIPAFLKRDRAAGPSLDVDLIDATRIVMRTRNRSDAELYPHADALAEIAAAYAELARRAGA